MAGCAATASSMPPVCRSLHPSGWWCSSRLRCRMTSASRQCVARLSPCTCATAWKQPRHCAWRQGRSEMQQMKASWTILSCSSMIVALCGIFMNPGCCQGRASIIVVSRQMMGSWGGCLPPPGRDCAFTVLHEALQSGPQHSTADHRLGGHAASLTGVVSAACRWRRVGSHAPQQHNTTGHAPSQQGVSWGHPAPGSGHPPLFQDAAAHASGQPAAGASRRWGQSLADPRHLGRIGKRDPDRWRALQPAGNSRPPVVWEHPGQCACPWGWSDHSSAAACCGFCPRGVPADRLQDFLDWVHQHQQWRRAARPTNPFAGSRRRPLTLSLTLPVLTADSFEDELQSVLLYVCHVCSASQGPPFRSKLSPLSLTDMYFEDVLQCLQLGFTLPHDLPSSSHPASSC